MPEKNKDGHYIYEGECQECGHKRYTRLSNFKSNVVTTCTHRYLLDICQLNAWYDKNKKQCLYCGEDIPLDNFGFEAYKERKFCNSSCAASYNNKKYKKRIKKKITNECKSCGQETQYPNKFCSTKCHKDYTYKSYIEKWKNGEISGTIKSGASDPVKRYIHEKYNNQCCKCGWHEINPTTGKSPLEVHHVDGDYQNNKEENLELLCPNCHSLTPSYKALNCGDGRKDRYK